MSVLAWGAWAVAAILVGRAVGVELSLVDAVFVTAALNLGVAIPVVSRVRRHVPVARRLSACAVRDRSRGGARVRDLHAGRLVRADDDRRRGDPRRATRRAPGGRARSSTSAPRRRAESVVAEGALDQAELVGLAHRVGAVLGAELAVDVRQVELHRLLRDPQLLRDLVVRLPARELGEDRDLAVGEAGRLGAARRRALLLRRPSRRRCRRSPGVAWRADRSGRRSSARRRSPRGGAPPRSGRASSTRRASRP